MEDLNTTIRSILSDPEKLEQLRTIAQSLGTNISDASTPSAQPPAQQPAQQSDVISSALQSLSAAARQNQANTNTNASGGDGLSSISQLLSTFNQNDKDMDLLRSLKPHFSPARSAKIDSVIQMMRLMRVIPTLRDSNLLGSSILGLGGDNR